jgi:hypothetical protein
MVLPLTKLVTWREGHRSAISQTVAARLAATLHPRSHQSRRLPRYAYCANRNSHDTMFREFTSAGRPGRLQPGIFVTIETRVGRA